MDKHWRDLCLAAKIPLHLNLSDRGSHSLPWQDFYQLQRDIQNFKCSRTSAGFAQSGRTSLLRLDLSAHKTLPDAALATLIGGHPNLIELSLRSCSLAGPATEIAIGQLSRLRRLNLEQCPLLKPQLLLKKLQSRSLSALTLSDQVLEIGLWRELSRWPLKALSLLRMKWDFSDLRLDMGRLAGLERLEIHQCQRVHPELLKHLVSQLSSLRDFRARHCSSIDDHLISRLSPSVQHIDLTWCESLPAKAYGAIVTEHRQLKSLKLAHCQLVANEFLNKLKAFSELTCLDIANCKLITKEGVVGFLEQSCHLKRLNFEGCASHPDIARALAKHAHLKELALPAHFHVNWLKNFEFAHLEQLYMRENTTLDNRGLVELAHSLEKTPVRYLNITGCCFEEKGLSSLAKLHHLRALSIGGRIGSPLQVAKQALRDLNRFRHLRQLQVELTVNLDLEVLEVLLQGPVPLRKLDLGPNVDLTLADIEKLISAHPLLQIEHYGYSNLPQVLKGLLFNS